MAQRPDVSRRLAAVLARDATAPVWLFVRPGEPLDSVPAFVVRAGGTVRRVSRWLHAVSAVLPPAALAAARDRRDLARIQPVARFGRRPGPDTAAVVEPFAPPSATLAPAQDTLFGPSAMPLHRLNLFPLVDHGLRGPGGHGGRGGEAHRERGRQRGAHARRLGSRRPGARAPRWRRRAPAS